MAATLQLDSGALPDSKQVQVTSQAMSWETQALEGHSSHGVQTGVFIQGPVGHYCDHASWRGLLCKHFFWHRLPEGLTFQLSTDSSSAPNLLLSNTISIHSNPNLSIRLNSSVPLTSTQLSNPASAHSRQFSVHPHLFTSLTLASSSLI